MLFNYSTTKHEEKEMTTINELPDKDIDKDELSEILEQHKLWLKSNGESGKRADLSRANLSSCRS